MRQFLVSAFIFSIASSSLAAQQPVWLPPANRPTINLWPSAALGAPANSAPETDITTSTDSLIAGRRLVRLGNVSKPTVTFYSAETPNSGAAIVVFPGGAYHVLAIDLEGTE